MRAIVRRRLPAPRRPIASRSSLLVSVSRRPARFMPASDALRHAFNLNRESMDAAASPTAHPHEAPRACAAYRPATPRA
ncbi:hypothetical protein C7S16_5537 [Burkholderia thailandensis]|uniref:Uncharacterized protein n=1 Tax=Burkholderia thailandensis TaxID=57975 RepID=A0AAW9CR57_BURTH|nr:hypothetical protein [Burkholderia thailandensis]MDW9251089.1 hypothetical protein [Burkholderia thailandensis]